MAMSYLAAVQRSVKQKQYVTMTNHGVSKPEILFIQGKTETSPQKTHYQFKCSIIPAAI